MVASSEQLVSLARDRQRVGSGDEYDVALAQANVATLPRHGAQPRARRTQQRCAPSRRLSAAIRRPRSQSPRCCRPGRARFRPACPPSSSSGGPTWSRPSAASPRRSIAPRRRRRRGCRASRSPPASRRLERALRAEAPRQSAVQLGAGPLQPIFLGGRCRRRSRCAPPSSRPRSPSTARRRARVRRSRGRARRPASRSRSARSTRERRSRENARALELANSATASARPTCARAAAAARAVLGAGRAAARAVASGWSSASTCISRSAAVSSRQHAVRGKPATRPPPVR